MAAKYIEPHPVTKAKYPDPTVLGERIFQSGKHQGQRWRDANEGFWTYMIQNVLGARPDTDMYLYAYHRVTNKAAKAKAQQSLGLKTSSGADVMTQGIFTNQLLKGVELVKGISPTLLPYQATSVSAYVRYWEARRAENKFFGALFADDMGLGKTIQAIETVERILVKAGRTGMEQARVLIVCQASLISNWADEIKRFSVMAEHSKVYRVNSKLMKMLSMYDRSDAPGTTIASAGWFIVSQDYCWRADMLLRSTWDAVIFDEAHFLRGLDSKRGQLLGDLKTTTIGKIILTGTPITNSAMDAYNFCRVCLPEEFAQGVSSIGYTMGDFASKFTSTVDTQYGPVYKGIKNNGDLGQLISRFCIKRLKVDVDKDMPPLFRTRVLLDCDPKLLVELTKAKFGVQGILDEYFGLSNGTGSVPPQLATLRRAIGIAKVSPVVELIKSVRESGESGSLVIFAYHKDVMDKLETDLVAAGETVSRIDGSTPTSKRGGEVSKFQAGETSIFLGQIVAAGTGITLTKAKKMFIVEPDFLPATNLQAEARIHRIGIKKDDHIEVTYCLLAEPDAYAQGDVGVDEKIYKSFLSKANAINKVFDEGAVTVGKEVVFEMKASDPLSTLGIGKCRDDEPELPEDEEEAEAREKYFNELGSE